jgi:hypothetical protein
LALALLVAVVMFFLSWGLSMSLMNDSILLSVNSLSLTPSPSSVSTIFLSSLVSGLVLVATGEELIKLVMFAEGKARWGSGYSVNRLALFGVLCLISVFGVFLGLNYLQAFSYFNMIALSVIIATILGIIVFGVLKKVNVSIPGVLVYVGFPVGFWAMLHGIQAYNNPVMIIPAFVNGVVLIVYLWKTRCILGCIFAHWIYNSAILLLTYLNGTANVPSGTPFFPAFSNPGYFTNSGYIYDGLLLAIVVGSFLFFLLPSLTREKSKK